MRRKFFPVVLVVLLVALLSAGFGQAERGTPPYNPVRLSHAQNGNHVQLGDKDVLEIALPFNPSTGYSWNVEEMNPGILAKIDTIEVETANGDPMLGATETQVLRFHGQGKGLTRLVLAYRRPWETNTTPVETYAIEVESSGKFNGRFENPSVAAAGGKTTDESTPVLGGKPGGGGGTTLPSYYNVCDKGGCTAIKNQGNCGSCWAFATAAVMESAIKMRTGVEKDISEQYLVSCNTSGYSCNGGWFAHDYHINLVPPGEPAAGAVYEGAFRYAAADVACNSPYVHNEKLASWTYIKGSSSVPTVAAIKQAIYTRGSVAVAVCVGPAFQRYTSGVFGTNECSRVNHAVVLTGWDDAQGAWIMRNSWGQSWGENGYMRIKYGTSAIGYGANYVVLP